MISKLFQWAAVRVRKLRKMLSYQVTFSLEKLRFGVRSANIYIRCSSGQECLLEMVGFHSDVCS